MEAAETVDAEAVEEAPGTELVVRDQAPPTLFGTDDPELVIERAAKVASALKDVLQRQGLTTKIRNKEHVNVEGWQTLGSMIGVFPVVTRSNPIYDVDNGILGYEAHVEARTRDGAVVGAGDGMCLKTETRGPWSTAEDYALRSMAQTRATSKALKSALGFVMTLAGYATTPAEEMPSEEPEAPTLPFGEPASVELVNRVADGLEFILDPACDVNSVLDQLLSDAGYLPRVVGRALLIVAAANKAAQGNDLQPEGDEVDGSNDDADAAADAEPEPDDLSDERYQPD